MTTSQPHREPRLTAQLLVASSDNRGGPSGQLLITVRPGSGRDVVELVGEIDIATAPRLRSTINRRLAAGRNNILVDLEAVTFLDCAAIRALITATRDVTHAGGTLQVTPNARCMRLLEITGETHRLNITDDRNSDGNQDLRVCDQRARRKPPRGPVAEPSP